MNVSVASGAGLGPVPVGTTPAHHALAGGWREAALPWLPTDETLPQAARAGSSPRCPRGRAVEVVGGRSALKILFSIEGPEGPVPILQQPDHLPGA